MKSCPSDTLRGHVKLPHGTVSITDWATTTPEASCTALSLGANFGEHSDTWFINFCSQKACYRTLTMTCSWLWILSTNLQAVVGGALVEEISPGPMKSWSQLSVAVEQLAQIFSSSRSSSQSIVQEIKCLIGSGSDQKQVWIFLSRWRLLLRRNNNCGGSCMIPKRLMMKHLNIHGIGPAWSKKMHPSTVERKDCVYRITLYKNYLLNLDYFDF